MARRTKKQPTTTEKPYLVIDTTPKPERHISIDGTPYRLLRVEDLRSRTLVTVAQTCEQIRMMVNQNVTLGTEDDPVLDLALDTVVRRVVEAPSEVLDRLSPVLRAQVVGVFIQD